MPPSVSARDDGDLGPERTIPLGFAEVRVRPGAHIAHFYQNDEERWELLVPFLETGLTAGEKCVFMAGAEQRRAALARLERAGIPADELLASDQLVLVEGASRPEELVAQLDRTLVEGGERFEGLRWSGDMTWALDRMPDSRTLMRWEAACSRVEVEEEGPWVVFFWQYSLSRFPGSVVMDALRTHSTCVIGRAVRQNPFHEDPESFLESLAERHSVPFGAGGASGEPRGPGA